jgi:hypothetical protein
MRRKGAQTPPLSPHPYPGLFLLIPVDVSPPQPPASASLRIGFLLTIAITSSTIISPASLRSDHLIGIAGTVIAFSQEH